MTQLTRRNLIGRHSDPYVRPRCFPSLTTRQKSGIRPRMIPCPITIGSRFVEAKPTDDLKILLMGCQRS